MVGHRRRKTKQHVGVGDVGVDIAVMADHGDGKLGKPLQQHLLVAGPHGFLDFGEDEEVGHSTDLVRGTRWYNGK